MQHSGMTGSFPLGWTFIGSVVAVAMAASGQPRKEIE
jgi:hypothetical protein